MIKKYINFFLFTCLCFIIADTFVKADEKDNFIVPSGAQFYDNNNGSLTAITTDFINNAGDNFYMSSSIHTIPNSSGAAIGFNLNEPLIAGYVYTISVSVGPIGCGETRLSSTNRIGVAGSLGSAQTYYQNGGNATIKFSDYQVAGQGYKGISYAFVPNTNGTYIILPYTTANNCSDVNYFYGYTINNLGSADNVSQQDINNSINNQTNIITNNIQSSEQNIINNQNENQEQTNALLGSCHKNLFNYRQYNNSNSNLSLNTSINGFNISAGSYYVSSDIKLSEFCPDCKAGKTYFLKGTSTSTNSKYIYVGETWNYNTSKVITSSMLNSTVVFYGIYPEGSSSDVVTISDIAIYSGTNNYSYSPFDENICSSKLDDTNQAINDVNDTLKDDDTKGAQDSAGGFFNDFTTDMHGLTGIITAPLSLISSITSSSCSPLVIPLPYVDKDLTLPCMGTIYSEYFGSFLTIYQIITFGIVAYWVCVRIFNLVKDFKNPDHDEIEVLDL